MSITAVDQNNDGNILSNLLRLLVDVLKVFNLGDKGFEIATFVILVVCYCKTFIKEKIVPQVY